MLWVDADNLPYQTRPDFFGNNTSCLWSFCQSLLIVREAIDAEFLQSRDLWLLFNKQYERVHAKRTMFAANPFVGVTTIPTGSFRLRMLG